MKQFKLKQRIPLTDNQLKLIHWLTAQPISALNTMTLADVTVIVAHQCDECKIGQLTEKQVATCCAIVEHLHEFQFKEVLKIRTINNHLNEERQRFKELLI